MRGYATRLVPENYSKVSLSLGKGSFRAYQLRCVRDTSIITMIQLLLRIEIPSLLFHSRKDGKNVSRSVIPFAVPARFAFGEILLQKLYNLRKSFVPNIPQERSFFFWGNCSRDVRPTREMRSSIFDIHGIHNFAVSAVWI